MQISGTKAVIAALPLKECIKIPGINDGSLFRKNVRQSLGNSNKVNKGIAKTLMNDAKDFFFLHNGITAICSKVHIEGNSQSAVKARELRSNDKAVLLMKKAYEQCYTDGYFVTKRGETVDTAKYNTNYILNLTDLGKQLIAWHSQRPTISFRGRLIWKVSSVSSNHLFLNSFPQSV